MPRCEECKGYEHDFRCSKFTDHDEKFETYLEEILEDMRYDHVFSYSKDRLYIESVAELPIATLKSPGWNELTREKLGGRDIQLYGYKVNWDDQKVWGDVYCLEWFYKTYGFGNVWITFGGEMNMGAQFAAEQFVERMERDYS